MENKKILIKKTCSFYVSEYHLVTMLLPYVKKRIDKNSVIKTILENNIEENMEKLISSINLDNKYKKSILDINWRSFKIFKYPEIEQELLIEEENTPINIIIGGKYEYVDMMNKNIEKYIEKKEINNTIIINNCYDVTCINYDLNKILLNHDKLLNTSGEKNIEDVFKIDTKNKIINE